MLQTGLAEAPHGAERAYSCDYTIEVLYKDFYCNLCFLFPLEAPFPGNDPRENPQALLKVKCVCAKTLN